MVKIAVIDTGIDLKNAHFFKTCQSGIGFQMVDNKIIISDDCQDEVGHGTAITDIIVNACNDVQIVPVKVIGINYYTEEDVLIEALKYVLDNIECQIVNMSLGLNVCSRCDELQGIVDRLKERGTIVISAFNNDGSMSYPAMLKNVIGVDSTYEANSVNYYEFIENSEVNIRGVGGNQRVLWLSGQHKVVRGSSFATAHITAIVAKLLNNNATASDICDKLRDGAARIISSNPAQELKMGFEMKKAIAFPYNKEMHSIVKFEELLSFDLMGIYDVRQSGNVGKSIASRSGRKYNVHNLFNIDWNSDFDTIIVGHINVLERMLHTDIRNYLLLKCKLHHKNMYSFDFISEDRAKMWEGVKFFYPYAGSKMLPQNTYGKLYHIDKPVIGVYGTGSKQGKFTLQLILKQYFQKAGYEVGHLGTEPSALLFGCQRVYPMGYENSVDIKGFDSISLLNKYMFEIAKNSEIIIVGSQANTVPPLTGNQCYYTTKQIEFLLGTQPDIVILCFNAHDSNEYICRTVKAIESLAETKVIAAVMFPLKLKGGWAGINGVMEGVTETDKMSFQQFFENDLHIPMYFLDNEDDLERLYNSCIDYFSA